MVRNTLTAVGKAGIRHDVKRRAKEMRRNESQHAVALEQKLKEWPISKTQGHKSNSRLHTEVSHTNHVYRPYFTPSCAFVADHVCIHGFINKTNLRLKCSTRRLKHIRRPARGTPYMWSTKQYNCMLEYEVFLCFYTYIRPYYNLCQHLKTSTVVQLYR